MSKSGINKSRVMDTAIDTLYFMGVKYVLHYGADMPHTKNVDGGDIGVFIVTDGVYHIFFQGYFDTMPFEDSRYNCEINKYAAVMAGASLVNLVTGRKDRILDNLISIGVSGLVSAIVDSLREKSRCV